MKKKRNSIANGPNLRFPGFEGEWEVKEFKEIVKINQGLQIPISKRLLEPREGALFYITNEFLNPKSDKRFYIEDASDTVICNEDDILMTRTGNTGKVVTNVAGAFHNNFFRIAYPKSVSKIYLYNFLLLPRIQNLIVRLAGTSTIPDLNHSDFYKIKFVFPSIEEQQKIAVFINLLDKRIETQNKIIKELSVLKSGVSKKIFFQELKLKDEDGVEFPLWKKMKLGDIAIKKSSNIAANKIEENFGKYIIYGASGILKYVDFYEEENDYISIVKDGAGVGRIFYCKGKSSVLATMDIIKPEKNLNTYFLYCLLDRINYKKYITGSTIPHIYFKDYKVEKVEVPCLEEQIKIANFLSSMDTKIDVEVQLLQKLEEQKKYLLQQMFC